MGEKEETHAQSFGFAGVGLLAKSIIVTLIQQR